jgi:hypothetical protein
MTTVQEAYQYKEKLIAKYPQLLKEELNGLYVLMIDNIEEGESTRNEVYLFEQSVKELLEMHEIE